MTKTIFFSLIFCLTLIISKAQKKTEVFELDDTGITVEKFDSTEKDENRFNLDNQIYTVGKKFTFSYYYQDKKGIKYLMTKSNDPKMNNWTFDKMENKNANSVIQVILTVTNGLSPFLQSFPDYNQTVIRYDFKQNNGEFWNNEATGLIENRMNLWMHPPRTDFFKILELNPFPYIKIPYRIGNKWTWKLNIGDHWADRRWLFWKGRNDTFYEYQISDKLFFLTKIGKLQCYKIDGKATSSLGITKLTAYFNEKVGFVKLHYTNIDGTKTILNIENVE